MPTKGELADLSNAVETMRLNFQEPCHSWTDDLPVCPFSGVGFSTNQKYRMDGFRREEHAFEDTSFHLQYDDDTHFYGVFDGQAGPRASDFAAQRMPAEILLGQLKDKETDQDVREVLHQAFLAVEKSFFESIDDLLAEKENIKLQLQGLRSIDALERFPDSVNRLKRINEEIQTGTTAVVALVMKNKLYVANVGDSRAVLCTEDKEGKVCICQLSTDHTFSNDDELLRLSHLSVDVQKIKNQSKSGLQNCTRCIGNYTFKGGYKEFDNLSEAEDEPIIAEPNIVGSIKIDEKCKCLLLMSSSLYKSLEEATGAANVNTTLVNMVLEQFSEQSTLNGVAQAVVDKVVRIHHDAFMKDGSSKRCQMRNDITLLVRNFNCTLPNADGCAIKTDTHSYPNALQQEIQKLNISEHNTLSDIQSIDNSLIRNDSGNGTNPRFMNDISSTSSSESQHPQMLFQLVGDLSLDEDGRVKPYVDFSDFFVAVEEACENGLAPKEWLQHSS